MMSINKLLVIVNSLANLIDDLTGDDFDMQGLAQFSNVVKRGHNVKQKCLRCGLRLWPELEIEKTRSDWDFNPYSNLPQEFEYVDLESVVGTELINSRKETIETAPSRARLASGRCVLPSCSPISKE